MQNQQWSIQQRSSLNKIVHMDGEKMKTVTLWKIQNLAIVLFLSQVPSQTVHQLSWMDGHGFVGFVKSILKGNVHSSLSTRVLRSTYNLTIARAYEYWQVHTCVSWMGKWSGKGAKQGRRSVLTRLLQCLGSPPLAQPTNPEAKSKHQCTNTEHKYRHGFPQKHRGRHHIKYIIFL